MNKDIIQGNWKELIGEVQKKWGKLPNDTLDQIEGDRTKLSGLIQKNYGLANDAADMQISEWEEGLSKAQKKAHEDAA